MIQFYQTWKMYPQLPMKVKTVLPDDGMPPTPFLISDELGAFMVEILPKPKPKPGVRWGHRVLVHCTCGRKIPFGRMNQHWPTHQ